MFRRMDILQKLSVVSVIWIIAAGVLIFFFLFLFAKRQIMRFTLKSRRGPYVSIGSDAPKELKHKISRLINKTPEIKHEPLLLNPTMEQAAMSGPNHFYYRMKAMDAFSKFDDVLRKDYPVVCRHPTQTMREYIMAIYPEYLSTADTDTVYTFLSLYEHARHKPEIFEESHFMMYSELLEELIECLEQGIKKKKDASMEQMKKLPAVDTEVTVKFLHKGMGKTKTSIPYNNLSSTSDKYNSRGQTRYRTRANSSEQAGLLESAPSSLRSSVEGIMTNRDSSEEHIQLVQVNMNTMPDI